MILTNERDIEIDFALEAWVVRQPTEGGDTTEDRVGLQRSQLLQKGLQITSGH